MANTIDPKKLVFFETHHLVEELERRGFEFNYIEHGKNSTFNIEGCAIVIIKKD